MKLRQASISVLVLLALLFSWPDFSSVQGQAPVRAIILSWDGTVPAMVQDLLRQGKLPNLARLIAGGVFSDSVVPVFPPRTASGFASLWTGAPPAITGITGNSVPRTPRSQFTILESASGFDSTSLRAEPLWMSAARHGRRVVVVQATQAWPFEPYVADGPFGPGQSSRLVLFEGYAGAGRDGVISAREAMPQVAQGWIHLPPSALPPREITFTIGVSRLFGLFIDDPKDPARGYDTLIVTRVKNGQNIEARLKAGDSAPGKIDKWSQTIEMNPGGQDAAGIFLRLFELKPDGSGFLLYFTRPVRQFSSRPELLSSLRKAVGAFVGGGANLLYREGTLGPTIPHGGNGDAERRYLETAFFAQRQLMQITRWAIESLPWELLFAYAPFPDEAEHLWRGYLEPALSGFQQNIADRLQPFLEMIYRSCDEYLSLLMRLRPSNTIIALVADHSMDGIDKVVKINSALQRAGLLVLDGQGRVDLTKTKAVYPAVNDSYILVNTKDHKGGIVSSQERAKVIAEIRRVLNEVRDNGRQVVTATFDALTEGKALGVGGEAGGDLYLELLPGYDFDPRFNASALILQREPYGMHVSAPQRESARTIMVLNGPGVAINRRVQDARLIDFAPTLSALLGMPPPRDAVGRVLSEAFSP